MYHVLAVEKFGLHYCRPALSDFYSQAMTLLTYDMTQLKDNGYYSARQIKELSDNVSKTASITLLLSQR